jgi:predicted dehydrogenase
MSEMIGIGVIGMGWMGVVHSRAYRQIADRFHEAGIRARLVICADDVESRASEGQQRLGFERYTTDWRQVISEPGVQVVNVATPNAMHLEVIQAAAEAGKHVFCEKPVGRNPRETAAITAAVHRAGVLSCVGYNYRWTPLVRYARQIIRDGKLGPITHYRGRFLVDYGSSPHGTLSWRFQRELAGYGTLGDLMSHVVDLAHMLAGPMQRVVAGRKTFITSRPLPIPGQGSHFSVNPDSPLADVTNEDYVGALVQFACGAQGTLEVCRVVKGPRCELAFELNGTKGAIKWNLERMNELELFLPDGTEEHNGPVLVQSGPQHPYYASFYPGPAISMSYEDLKLIEAFEFLRSVSSGTQGEPGVNEALAVAEVQDAIERSWASERWESVQRVS